MKRYLWVLLLAACTAPTGEVTKTAKTNEKTTEIQEKLIEKPEPPKVEPESVTPRITDTKIEEKILEGVYFGLRKLTENEIKDIEEEDDIPNDRRLVLDFDKNGKVGWGDADHESTAKEKARKKEYTYEVNGDTVTVKQNGKDLLTLKIRVRNEHKFLYITQDSTHKDPQLTKMGVDYRYTGLVLNGKEITGGYGGAAGTRVDPPIPAYTE